MLWIRKAISSGVLSFFVAHFETRFLHQGSFHARDVEVAVHSPGVANNVLRDAPASGASTTLDVGHRPPGGDYALGAFPTLSVEIFPPGGDNALDESIVAGPWWLLNDPLSNLA